jgi:hypothetical protein
MQQGYVPDGWLGIILGSKIYVNFTKNAFDECMRKLIFEIEHHAGQKSIVNETTNNFDDKKTTKLAATTMTESKCVEKWSRDVR